MTREEKRKVRNALRISAPIMALTQEEFNDYIQTLNKIMDWLEQEPCDDVISRQAVINITWEEPSYTDALNVLTEVRDKVKALPPVNPQNTDVLDEIRAEIEQILTYDQFTGESYSAYEFKSDALEIINKYTAKEE